MSPLGKICSLAGALFFLSAGPVIAQDDPDRIGSTVEGNFGVGDPDVFASKYRTYVAETAKTRNPNLLTVTLGFVKGVSSFTGVAGGVSIDMATGTFNASFSGLTPGATYSLSLVDDQDDDETLKELLPPVLFKIADVRPVDKNAAVKGTILVALLGGATVDRLELRLVGKTTSVVASGSINLFQKLLFSGASLVKSDATRTYAPSTLSAATLLLSSIIPKVDTTIIKATTGVATPVAASGTTAGTLGGSTTQAGSGSDVQLDKLISKGAKLFFEETFRGNGRTCGTCHPRDNNFTIDVPFINSRPANDPLFVAEFNPALANLEKPALMRQFGLILENLDGLEDPVNKFVMRSVPHTLGMQVSLNQDVTQMAPPFNTTPAQMTGWSGDGAPGAGSLRDFATGAVTQHFTTSLQRIPGQHFKLPTNKQLDAMEAFQLSLGRDKDPDLSKITFNDAVVQAGKNLFNNGNAAQTGRGGRCAVCHNSGGANFNPANPAPPPNPAFPNRNFNTQVEDVPHPARSVLNFPLDGGFGALPANLDGSLGNMAFNTASAIEAADTAPFFHNNVVTTLEGVIEFYAGPQFNAPPAPLAVQFAFSPQEVTQLAQFLRGINTLQNIDLSARELDEITQIAGNPEAEMQKRLQSAFNDIRDGINVLTQGGLYPTAVNQLVAARNFISQAQQPNTGNTRRFLAGQAIGQLNLARATIAAIAP
jgi:cytochrome c peroxidase